MKDFEFAKSELECALQEELKPEAKFVTAFIGHRGYPRHDDGTYKPDGCKYNPPDQCG